MPKRARINEVPPRLPRWLDQAEDPVILYSFVQMHRNLRGRLFPHRVTAMERNQVIQEVLWAFQDLFGEVFGTVYAAFLTEVPVEQVRFLMGAMMVRAHQPREGEAAIFPETGDVVLEVNRHDHLVLHVRMGGLNLDNAYQTALLIERGLARVLQFARHRQFGYTTTHLFNAGTGLRLGVVGSFPAISGGQSGEPLENRISSERILAQRLETFSQVYLSVIQNRVTLGCSDAELLDATRAAAQEARRMELSERERLARKDRLRLEDKVWRAYGVLRHARLLGYRDILYYLGNIRIGYGVLDDILEVLPIPESAYLLLGTQTDVLAYLRGLPGDETENIKAARARWVQERLARSKEAEFSPVGHNN